ncbi:conserved hypothetical protein [Burkholderia ambifaria MEX-5]|uniref:Uncharacterized protein n=1 Tax=Burkholderia ambifaria MEX-5 TaxID=396597 RepID=B1T624_9BURK|nr:conserved hypothetical protein [Burkholderia ambifaria MEX-5]
MTCSNSCNSSAGEKTGIPRDRAAAIARHEDLRGAGSPPVVLGKFYRDQLDRQLWPSQATLAADFNVSKAIVTRSIQASLLPPEVVAAFGGPRQVSYRTAEIATKLIGEVGKDLVMRRALTVPANIAPSKVISILSTGVVHAEDSVELRLSLGANGKHLRIDAPHINLVVPHIPLLQDLLNTLLPSVLPRRR